MLGAAVCLPTFNAGAAAVNIGRSSEKVKEYGYDLNVFDGLIDDVEIYAGVLPYEDIKETTALVPDMNYPASHYAGDIYRPAFHGMPTANWTNETNGAIYYNGKFHVFFQKCPTGNYLAHMHIGHIYSDDLINWREDRTAFAPTSWYDLKGCWSGSVFQNPDFTEILVHNYPNTKAKTQTSMTESPPLYIQESISTGLASQQVLLLMTT